MSAERAIRSLLVGADKAPSKAVDLTSPGSSRPFTGKARNGHTRMRPGGRGIASARNFPGLWPRSRPGCAPWPVGLVEKPVEKEVPFGRRVGAGVSCMRPVIDANR
ncbi:hypothetical protein GCM10010295_14100 [Streptomyces intermedius]